MLETTSATQLLRNLIEEREFQYVSHQDVQNALTDLEVLLNLPITAPAISHRLVKLRHAWAGPLDKFSIAACGHLIGTDMDYGDDPSDYDEKDCPDCVSVVKLRTQPPVSAGDAALDPVEVRGERETRLLSGIEEQTRILNEALRERNRLIREAVAHRVPMAKLAAAAHLSRAHLYKVANRISS